jgi:hypothetical protein
MIPVAALSVGRFLLRREVIIGVAVVGLFAMWQLQKAAWIRVGQERQVRVELKRRFDERAARDSTIIAGLDEAIRRANARFFAVDSSLGVSLDSSATLAEKLKARKTDTVLVTQYIAQSEQLREDCQACRETSRAAIDTAAIARKERDDARARIRAIADSLANAPRAAGACSASTLEKAGWALGGVGADELVRWLSKLLRR